MSTGVSLAVIVGGVFVIAAVLIAVTRRPSRPGRPSEREPAVMWLRPRDHRDVHAFWTVELRAAGLPDVEALAFCGRWPVAALIPVGELAADDDAPRCAVCERAVERMEHRQE